MSTLFYFSGIFGVFFDIVNLPFHDSIVSLNCVLQSSPEALRLRFVVFGFPVFGIFGISVFLGLEIKWHRIFGVFWEKFGFQ